MKHLRIYFPLVSLSMLMALALSCARVEPDDASYESVGLNRVKVVLDMSVASVDEYTVHTKTLQDPDLEGVTNDGQIDNFIVLQYDGVTASAPMIGTPMAFDHWPLHGYDDPSDPEYDESDVVTLVASDHDNTVVILANTFSDVIDYGSTLGDLYKTCSGPLSMLSEVWISPGDGNEYLRMSGSVRMETIYGGLTIPVSLKRNISKVEINITNASWDKSGDDVITLSQVQLRDINTQYYYCTQADPGLDASVVFTDPYIPGISTRFHDTPADFPSAKNPGGAGQGTAESYVFYVPANLRGETTNTLQYNKGEDAPTGATSLVLYGTYGPNETPITYTYYLGGNLTNDFNLKPNYKYTYNIIISSKGDASYDTRVEDMEEVKFQTDANSYMLHPPRVSGTSRIYAFPVRRAAVFWNEPGVNLGVYGAWLFEGSSDYESLTFTGTTNWTAEILWSDFDMTSYPDFLQVASGTGFDPTNPSHTQPYIKVKVSAGMQGNVVVAMKIGEQIAWSWHLWITDYNPDAPMEVVEHQYIYPVEGGDLLRYYSPDASSIWNTCPTATKFGLARGFLMDRNLGELGSSPSHSGSTGLRYQYGRKDPFLDRTVNNAGDMFYLGGTSLVSIFDSGRFIYFDTSGEPGNRNVRYSMTHPMVRLGGRSAPNRVWTAVSDDLATDGNNPSYLWNDRLYTHHSGDGSTLEPHKSIYDPCPPGWKTQSRYSNLIVKNTSNTESGIYTMEYQNSAGGWYYYPEGYVNRNETGIIYIRNTSYWKDESTTYYIDCSFSDVSGQSWVQNYTPRENLCKVRCYRE